MQLASWLLALRERCCWRRCSRCRPAAMSSSGVSAISAQSVLDALYRRFVLTKFFTQGWGRPQDLRRICRLRRRISDRSEALALVAGEAHTVKITKDITKGSVRVVDGEFRTPALHVLGDIVPSQVQTCHFQLVTSSGDRLGERHERGPLCVQYAGTGDHFFWRRRKFMAVPMLKERNISSLLIENPFYGLRKPPEQLRSSLRRVSDLFLMGSCLIKESIVLYKWAELQGFWPLISHGISMGGHFACLSASVWPKPIGIVPCLSLPSAAATFTVGVMADAIPWDILHEQYTKLEASSENIRQWIESEKDAFQAGLDFAHNYLDDAGNREAKYDRTFSPTERERLYLKVFSSLRLPFLASCSSERQRLRRESISFMQGIMDECTHISNFPMPVDPSLVVAVAAGKDAYQPREFVQAIPSVWPGAQVRFLEEDGHLTSYLFRQSEFRKAIYEVVDNLIKVYEMDTGKNETGSNARIANLDINTVQ